MEWVGKMDKSSRASNAKQHLLIGVIFLACALFAVFLANNAHLAAAMAFFSGAYLNEARKRPM